MGRDLAENRRVSIARHLKLFSNIKVTVWWITSGVFCLSSGEIKVLFVCSKE
jgi:hypothetical protein